MAIRTLAEFLEARKADRRARGYDDSLITEEEPAAATDSSGKLFYGVVSAKPPNGWNHKMVEGRTAWYKA